MPPRPSSLQIIAPDRRKHGEQMIDLVAKTFGCYSDHFPAMEEEMLNDPFYSFAATRIGIMDGQVVTHFGVFDYQMRVGSARLRTGGIGGVATHWKYRKKGLMDLTARAAVAGMRALGFDFSILFGIKNFYHRFGYTRAWSEREMTLTLADLPEPAKRLQEFRFERRPELERLFNRENAELTGTAVRPTYGRWNSRGKQVGFAWKDGRGKVAGYIAVDDRGSYIEVREAVGEPAQILAAVSFAARKFACDDIHFRCLHHQTPLAKALRRGTAQERVYHNKNGGAMARVIHLPRALGKMAGELERRLGDSGFADYRGKLAISDGDDWATVHLAGGKVRVTEGREEAKNVVRAGPAAAQLVLGTADPAEILDGEGVKATAEAIRLVRALFPVQHPMLHAGDRY